MLKILINTRMLPIIDVGMYGTNLDINEVNTDMDYNDYVKELEKVAQQFYTSCYRINLNIGNKILKIKYIH